jgi:hypothetical protein
VPKISWSAFIDCHPAAYLVVGVLPKGEANPRPRLELLARRLGRLGLTGSYALVIDRKSETPEIHCIFERKADARRVTEALKAEVTSRYPGWKRQRSFLLDGAAVAMIETALREVPR